MRIKKLLLAIATLTLVSAAPVKHQFTAAEQQQKILCKWEMREVIGNICKTFPYIFIVYYFFLLPLVKS